MVVSVVAGEGRTVAGAVVFLHVYPGVSYALDVKWGRGKRISGLVGNNLQGQFVVEVYVVGNAVGGGTSVG